MARPWERPKAKAMARARARASNGLMCVKEGRPNVMLKENSERKIAAPGGTRTHNLLLSWQMLYLNCATGTRAGWGGGGAKLHMIIFYYNCMG